MPSSNTRRRPPGGRWAPALLAGLTAMLLAAPAASAYHGSLPSAVFPSTTGCSSSQRAYLKTAWDEGSGYVARSGDLIDYIASRSEPDRRRLWSQDFTGFGNASDWHKTPSPQRYFGAYNSGRLVDIRDAIRQARRRFKGETIYRLRCSTTCAKAANHAVKGRIVTCPRFWDRARNTNDTLAERTSRSAFTLAHEVFHHIKAGSRYILDTHTLGVPDGVYYGIKDVTYLARNAPDLAFRNNDTYAFFGQEASRTPKPTFTGVFVDKEGSGTGGMFEDLSWAQLQTRKSQQAAAGQYLADVETYVRHGERRYAALWRVGGGDGTLMREECDVFLGKYHAIRGVEDLIDVVLYPVDGKFFCVGVYRKRAPDAQGVGALRIGMTFEQLDATRTEFIKLGAYLSDVETYVKNGERRYAGIWRIGPSGAFYALRAQDFGKTSNELRATQQLIDLERYTTEDGVAIQIGVWVPGATNGSFTVLPWKELVALMQSSASNRTLIDIEEHSLAPMEA